MWQECHSTRDHPIFELFNFLSTESYSKLIKSSKPKWEETKNTEFHKKQPLGTLMMVEEDNIVCFLVYLTMLQ
jgi:hypothetical protein